MKYFDRLFYYIFKNDSRYGGNEFINAFFATLGLFYLEFSNLFTIVFSLRYIFKFNIDFSYNTYKIILIVIFLLNALYFLLNKRYSKLKESFMNETENIAVKNNRWCKLYIIISLVSLPLIVIASILITKILN